MSLKLKTSLATILFIPTFAFAGEYDLQIKNLQNQINSLNKKLTEYENKKIDLSSSLDGLYFTGRLHATGSWVHKNSDLKNSEFMTYQDDDGHGNIINETIIEDIYSNLA